MQGEIYCVLIVLSQVSNKDLDKDLRLKYQALAEATPQDFGINRYLLLNEETPLVEMAAQQEYEFDRMSKRIKNQIKTESDVEENKSEIDHLINSLDL